MYKKLIITFTLLLLFAVIGLSVSWLTLERYLKTPVLLQQESYFTVPAGLGRVGLEKRLEQQGVIQDSSLLKYVFYLRPDLAKFKAGTYQIVPSMSLQELLTLLASGKESQFSIRFIEGTRLQDWLLVLQQTPYIQHTLVGLSNQEIAKLLEIPEGNHVEGWLYPDTYLYTANTTDAALLKRAHARMKRALDETWQARQENLPYSNAYEMLIMASIIEKETGIDSERDKVASVFVNRMRIGMKLQTDPTVIYGMGANYNGNITKKDLLFPTPYNTYTITGLPPTPIAMPSIMSLKAAAHPKDTTYLYFVADGKGGHVFNKNLQGHNRSVRDYLRTLREKSRK